jgi:hypothetical protein
MSDLAHVIHHLEYQWPPHRPKPREPTTVTGYVEMLVREVAKPAFHVDHLSKYDLSPRSMERLLAPSK